MMNSKEYVMPNGKKVIFEYDINGVGKITLECMDELMLMIAGRLQDDTVSRQYLLAEIDDLADEFSEVDENGLHSERWRGIVDAKCVVVNAPSVSDRLQGEWVGEADGYYNGELIYDTWYCSNCDYVVDDDEPPTWNFCPNCGARMKGADDEY